MTSVFRTVFSFVLVCLFVASGQISLAQPGDSNGSIVFHIGTFDRSSAEFAAGSAKRPVNFVVEQSDPAKDWYATQLAVLASAEDSKTLRPGEAPGVINFSIDSPKVKYRLHLSLLIESASVPALRRQAAGQ